jgi:aspartate aminotransferase
MTKISLSGRVSNMSESATLALNARVKQLAAEGQIIYNLTAGELATDTPLYIQEYVAKNLKLNKYTPVAGLPELRQSIADNAKEFYQKDWIMPENVIVTAGVKPAIYTALLSIINPGDEVILPKPAWGSYYDLIELAGGKVVEVNMSDKFDIDPQAIFDKLSEKTKAVIIASPHNPTGAVASKQALDELAAELRGTNVTIIADDIYAKLVYTDNFIPTPYAEFENCIIVNGYSKSQALTGWRIGYAIANKEIIDAMVSITSHIIGNASLPAQEAAIAALSRDDKPPQTTIDALIRQRRMVIDTLNVVGTVSFVLPDGAFYFFLDLRQITNSSAKWCEDLLSETGVALVPGEAFRYPGFARLTFVTDEVTLKVALDYLVKFIKNSGVKQS